MRNDVWTRCIDATLYIKGLLATPVAAVVSDPECEDEKTGASKPALRVSVVTFILVGYVRMSARAVADGPLEVVKA
jgi:hypothetical protein